MAGALHTAQRHIWAPAAVSPECRLWDLTEVSLDRAPLQNGAPQWRCLKWGSEKIPAGKVVHSGCAC